MYAIANTLVSVLRGTEITTTTGDIVDTEVTAVYQHIIAFISYPTMSPLRPIVLGSQVYEPAMPDPSTTRLAACSLPSNTDIRNTDQILDEYSGLIWEVYQVTALGNAGATPDLVLTLKRVTTTEQA